MAFDWGGLKQAAQAQIERVVREVAAQRPGDPIYGAFFHSFYADDTAISWPCLAIGTTQALDGNEALRWSGPDHVLGEDAPDNGEDAWADAIHAEAHRRPGREHWDRTYARYQRTFATAAKAARSSLAKAGLIKSGVLTKDFLALAMDEAMELVPLSLTPAQVRSHFPHLDAAETERRRLATLPPEQQARELVAMAIRDVYPRPDGFDEATVPLGSEETADLLTTLGPAAVPVLLTVASALGNRQCWAMIIVTRIGFSNDAVVNTLLAVLVNQAADDNARAWAGCALGRLDHMDLVTAEAATLPEHIAVRAIGGPFTAYQEIGTPIPLDYAPLDRALRANPGLQDALMKQVRGRYRLNVTDVPAAIDALGSPWGAISKHAAMSLRGSPLTVDQRTFILDRLDALGREYPNPELRVIHERMASLNRAE